MKHKYRSEPRLLSLAAMCALMLGGTGCTAQEYVDLSDPKLYPQIERSLLEELGSLDPFQAEARIVNTETFKRLEAEGTEDEFLLMAQNENQPTVSLAAFYAIRRKNAKAAPLAATNILMHSDWINKPAILEGVKKYLIGLKDKPKAFKCLDHISAGSRGLKKINLMVLAEIFTKNGTLVDWFEQYSRQLDPLWLGVVLGQIYPMDGKVSPSKKIQEALQECAKHSGYARYTYLLLSGVDSTEYLQTMKLALADPEIDDEEISWLVHSRKGFIKEHIEVGNLDIPKKRKDLIRNSLD